MSLDSSDTLVVLVVYASSFFRSKSQLPIIANNAFLKFSWLLPKTTVVTYIRWCGKLCGNPWRRLLQLLTLPVSPISMGRWVSFLSCWDHMTQNVCGKGLFSGVGFDNDRGGWSKSWEEKVDLSGLCCCFFSGTGMISWWIRWLWWRWWSTSGLYCRFHSCTGQADTLAVTD